MIYWTGSWYEGMWEDNRIEGLGIMAIKEKDDAGKVHEICYGDNKEWHLGAIITDIPDSRRQEMVHQADKRNDELVAL